MSHVRILPSTSVLIRPTTVQIPNLALFEMKRMATYTVKKVIGFPVTSREVTNQTLPPSSRPGRVWLVTSRLVSGKPITFFYSVLDKSWTCVIAWVCIWWELGCPGFRALQTATISKTKKSHLNFHWNGDELACAHSCNFRKMAAGSALTSNTYVPSIKNIITKIMNAE